MLKKALKKISKVTSRKKESLPKPAQRHPPARLLTAEGWKRLMMKKHRK